MQNDNLKLKIIKIVPIILALAAAGHFVFRQSNSRVAGAKDSQIDWEAIDPMISLLPREIYAAEPGLIDASNIIKTHNKELYPEDRVKFFPDPTLGLGSMLSVQRALPVEFQDGDEKQIIRTWEKTVDGFLAEQSIEVGEKDVLEPSRETALNPETKITITRVVETEVKKIELIPFATKTRNDPELEKGKTMIEQKGQKGQRAKYYLVRRENGKIVSEKFLRLETIKESVDEIIILGTKVVIFGEGKATWYASPAMTAAHNSLPRGSRVRVVNKANGKEVVVKIIGGGIQGSAIIDLSPDAFKQLAPLSTGVIAVRLEKE